MIRVRVPTIAAFSGCLLWFCSRAPLSVHAAGVTNVAGALFSQPDECTPRLSCTLLFGTVEHDGPTEYFVTRGYNGQIPGPTIRISPGDILNIVLVNNLADVENTDFGVNLYRKPNTTNLHLHGLHVSPALGQDNVQLEVPPGSTVEYSYQFPQSLNASIPQLLDSHSFIILGVSGWHPLVSSTLSRFHDPTSRGRSCWYMNGTNLAPIYHTVKLKIPQQEF